MSEKADPKEITNLQDLLLAQMIHPVNSKTRVVRVAANPILKLSGSKTTSMR